MSIHGQPTVELTSPDADSGIMMAITSSPPRRKQVRRPVVGIDVYARLACEHDQWYAEATDYQVVGVGETREAALESLRRSMRAYFRGVQHQGGDTSQARRPASRWASITVRALALIGRAAPGRYKPALRIRL